MREVGWYTRTKAVDVLSECECEFGVPGVFCRYTQWRRSRLKSGGGGDGSMASA
jgi:hypothetical protein